MSITTNAVALVPGYDKHSKAEDRIRAEIIDNRNTQYDSPISDKDLLECALSGDEFPKDIHGHNEAILRQKVNTGVRNRMLNETLKQLHARKQKLIIHNSAEALAYVRHELTTLMDEVRSTHRVLGNVRTAEQVLADGRPKIIAAWQKTASLIARYSEILGAQRVITLPALGKDDAYKIKEVGLIRDSLEQSDHWLTARRRAASHRAAEDAHDGVRNYDSWLRAGGSAPSVGSEGSWSYLIWLATKAEPWVPTADELATAHQAAKTAVTPVEVRSLATQEHARDRYFEIIDSKPLIPYTRSPRSAETEPITKSNTPRRIDRSSPSFAESALRAMGL